MQKFWSILFGGVLFACLAISVAAPFVPGWWLPKNIASFGGDVDALFYLILAFTTFFFVLTEVILVYAMWRFASRPGGKSTYIHGSHKLEVFWTAVPAAILLLIAFSQVRAWARIKYQSRMPEPDQVIQVTARQWEWRVRYPKDIYLGEQEARSWAETAEFDDLRQVNEIHTWLDEQNHVKIYLKTQDVLHSLYFPNLRLKQDALPGKTIPMWFRVTEANTEWDPETKTCKDLNPSKPEDRWEFACAELCGARHYAMRGRLYVHKNKADYLAWFKHALDQQDSHEPDPPTESKTTAAAE